MSSVGFDCGWRCLMCGERGMPGTDEALMEHYKTPTHITAAKNRERQDSLIKSAPALAYHLQYMLERYASPCLSATDFPVEKCPDCAAWAFLKSLVELP